MSRELTISFAEISADEAEKREKRLMKTLANIFHNNREAIEMEEEYARSQLEKVGIGNNNSQFSIVGLDNSGGVSETRSACR